MIANDSMLASNRENDDDILTNYNKKLELLQGDLAKLLAIKEKLEERLSKSESKEDSNENVYHEIDTFNGSMKCGSEIPYSISHVNIFEQYKEEKSENLGLMKTYLRQNTLQTTSKWSRYPIVSQRSAVYSEDDEEDELKRIEQLDMLLSKVKLSKDKESQ